jgi:hypothetical protein
MTVSKIKKISIAAAIALFAIISSDNANAQRVAVGTNILYWATGTVNLSSEVAINPKTTINLSASSNIPGLIYYGKKERNRKLWHWNVQPEVRFWNTEAFNRGFVGIHAGGGAFDAGGITMPLGLMHDFGKHRYEGWMAGAGVSYGYQWWVSPHWNLEATLGFGYMYMEFNRFETPASKYIDQEHKTYHYFGPTRVGLSFSYLFRSKK